MNIYLVRHGQTNLNKAHLMQGLTDEPLNERGLEQAKKLNSLIGNISFDAVYASPLGRAINTGAIAAGVDTDDVITDERLIETDFGRYEKRPYALLGIPMSLYWAFPEIFKAPYSVETVEHMVERASSFLAELEGKNYENVLIAGHGGIMRALNGYLLNKKNGIKWRPKMKNCEVRVYEVNAGKRKLLKIMK